MTAAVSYCTFRLGDALYGVEVRDVKEVAALPPLTPVPHAPPAVAGLVNIRGQIHLALDPRPVLGLRPAAGGSGRSLVLFKPHLGDPAGVIVDAVGDIVALRHADVEPRGDAPAGDGPVAGFGKAPGELITLLDARGLLSAARLPGGSA